MGGAVPRVTELVLASGSPRRQQLLSLIGLKFRVKVSSVPEDDFHARLHDPAVLVSDLALAKAMDVASEEPNAVVLAADTVVAVGPEVLGKPADPEDAVQMLRRLQGRDHRVLTGVAVVNQAGGRRETAVEETRVYIRSLDAEEIRAYVASGEPMDKAGAYAVQGLGAVIVTRLEGCYYNVVGLPLARTTSILRSFGIEVLKRGEYGRSG